MKLTSQMIKEKAKELGIVMVVESETLTPDGPTEVAQCAEFLKAN